MKIEDDDADEKVELVYVEEEEDDNAGKESSICELHRLIMKELAEHGLGAKKLRKSWLV